MSEPSSSPPSAKDIIARCGLCGCTGIMPSPLDSAKGCRVRSWTPKSVGGNQCELCFEVHGLIRNLPADRRIPSGTEAWQVLLQAFASLKLEGAKIVDQGNLLARFHVLMSVQGLVGTAAMASGAGCPSSSSGTTVTTRSENSDNASGMLRRLDTEVANHFTPKKKLKTNETAGSTVSRGASSDTLASPVGVGTAASSTGGVHEEGDEGGLEQDDGEVHELQEGSELEPVTLLSVEGVFTKSKVSQSMTKFRATVNGYCEKMTTLGWFEALKPPTLKALHRRLLAYESDILNGLDIDMIRVYTQLSQRLSAILSCYKALSQWLSMSDDVHLRRFGKLVPAINMYFKFVGGDPPMRFAADLQVVCMYSKFSEAWVTTKCVGDALKHIAQDELVECFSSMSTGEFQTPVKAELKDKKKAKGGASTVAEVQPPQVARSVQDSQPEPKSKLVCADSAKDWLATVLDKAIQMKMHELSDEEGKLASQADSMCDDLSVVANDWNERFGGEEVENIRFGDLVQALATVFEVSGSRKAAITPSLVRDARQIIFKSSSTTMKQKPLRMAEAMSHYKVCCMVMENAKVVASSGLQDQAADQEFKHALSSLHGAFATALEDITAWVTNGNRGGWQDASSMMEHLRVVRAVLVQVRTVSDLWSLARLEEQTDSLTDVFSLTCLVVDVGSIAAAKDFHATLSAKLDGAQVSGAVVAAGGHDPKEDDPSASLVAANVGVLGECSTALAGEAHQGSDGVPSVAEEVPDLSKLAPAAAALKTNLGNMITALIECAQVATNLFDILVNKLGESFGYSVRDVLADPHVSLRHAMENKTLFDAILQYFDDIIWLAPRKALDLTDDETTTDPEHTQRLVSFCNAHRQLGDEIPLKPSATVDMEQLLESTGFTNFAQWFQARVAEQIFDLQAVPTVTSSLNALEHMELRINPIDSACVNAIPQVECIFGRLIEAPKASKLSEWINSTGADEDLTMQMQQWPHNSLLTSLSELVSSCGLTTLPSKRIRKLDIDDNSELAPPTNIVLQTLSMSSLLLDIASLAAALHEKLFSPTPSQAAPTMTMLTDSVPYLISNLSRSLDKLDKFQASSATKSLEAEGWRMPITASMAQVWHGGMVAFKGRVVQHVLELWAAGLTAAAQRAQAETPAWSACVQNGEWDEKLATSMLVGKSKAVVKAHNTLFEQISKLKTAATIAGIHPILHVHDITAEAVAIALHALVAVKDAATVCDGMQLLATYRDSHLGPGKASAFLSKFSPALQPNIPEVFWQLVQALAADAGATATRADDQNPARSASGSITPTALAAPVVKEEPAADPAQVEVPAAALPAMQNVKQEPGRRVLKSKKP